MTTLVTAWLITALLFVATVAFTPRLTRPFVGVLSRAVLVLLTSVGLVASVGLKLNADNGWYVSWSDLAGESGQAETTTEGMSAAAAAQAQIDAIREATQAAESALLGLANVAADALSEAATEAVATAARTSVEYLAQWLADLIARHGVPVQFEEMVQPSWLAAGATSPKAKGKKA